ncbi:hypothetical protein [Halobellus limi]|uniref:Uncharacterized protein n=1 Tax=Halobellus limi TaxID=699433 RepID=A0A1H5W1S1_9EURY|nr:hypothetical protein [Halobellus limi]QCC46555.1 hypothetical protein DV707_02065 [Halobellus limi]SEF93435.1 hypothetical protein SAMN04488133_1143 [Halobellus limi]
MTDDASETDRELSLGVPRGVLESLPEDGDNAAADMKQAVAGLEGSLEDAIDSADSEAEAASYAVDVVEHLEDRMETYDGFVPELRAWGQSPIYAIAWRNLYAELIAQIYEHDWLAAHIDRERNYRLVEDGIRFGDR